MTLSRYALIPQDEYKSNSSYTEFNFSENYKMSFLSQVKKDLNISEITEYTIETAELIREKLLNLSNRSNGDYLVSRYPDKLYAHLKKGEPLLCGEIARLYGFILHSYGFNVRYITISRSIFDAFDRHSTIEIWDEKKEKWIITDPTFNISFKCDTNYLSSDEIYDLIHSGSYNSIEVVRGKRTKYETPIENFYISYFSLFNNVYFIKTIQPFNFTELPPFRWFESKYKVYLVQSLKFPIRSSSMKIQNSIMFFILLLNPVSIILLSINVILSGIKIKTKNKANLYGNPLFVKASRFSKKL